MALSPRFGHPASPSWSTGVAPGQRSRLARFARRSSARRHIGGSCSADAWPLSAFDVPFGRDQHLGAQIGMMMTHREAPPRRAAESGADELTSSETPIVGGRPIH